MDDHARAIWDFGVALGMERGFLKQADMYPKSFMSVGAPSGSEVKRNGCLLTRV